LNPGVIFDPRDDFWPQGWFLTLGWFFTPGVNFDPRFSLYENKPFGTRLASRPLF
jgi:hypothetical protein